MYSWKSSDSSNQRSSFQSSAHYATSQGKTNHKAYELEKRGMDESMSALNECMCKLGLQKAHLTKRWTRKVLVEKHLEGIPQVRHLTATGLLENSRAT
eukprot:2717679-Amphidinium_carterae.1